MNHLSGRKIGILGGSFDPVHNGHLAIARAAYTDFDLDEVWFIPAGHSPNKNESGMTRPEYRAEMVALAVKPYPYFKMSTVEIEAEAGGKHVDHILSHCPDSIGKFLSAAQTSLCFHRKNLLFLH